MLALLPSLLSPGDAAALQAASQAGNGLPPSIHVFPHAPCHIDLISAVDGTAGETSSSGNNNGTGSPKCTIWSVAFLPGLAHSPEQGREAGGDAHMQDHGGTGAAATHMQAKALHLAVLMHRCVRGRVAGTYLHVWSGRMGAFYESHTDGPPRLSIRTSARSTCPAHEPCLHAVMLISSAAPFTVFQSKPVHASPPGRAHPSQS